MIWNIYYIIRRRVGRVKAEEALALLEQLPIEIPPVDDQIVIDELKLADFFQRRFIRKRMINYMQGQQISL